MPVTADERERKPRQLRAWFCVPLGALVLVLALPSLPFIRPVRLQCGGTALMVYGWQITETTSLPFAPVSFFSTDQPSLGVVGDWDDGDHRYAVLGAFHQRAVFLPGFAYCVTWFKGRRVK